MNRKTPGPRIAARAVWPVIAGAQALGWDADAWLAEAGIDGAIVRTGDGAIPFSQMTRLWSVIEKRSLDPFSGLHIAEAVPLDSLGLHVFAMRASGSLRTALRIATSFHRLVHETTILEFDEAPGVGRLIHRTAGGGAVPRQPAEFLATIWVRLAREVVPSAWNPCRICFAHDRPADTTEYRRVLGGEVIFNATATELHLPAEILDLPNPRTEPALLELLQKHAASLPRFPNASTTAERVRETLATQWPLHDCTAHAMASALFMSRRTLTRLLADEGKTFSSIRAAVQRERAEALLRRPEVSIAETAFAVGFSELSAFYRAFRRWNGCSPAEWRTRQT